MYFLSFLKFLLNLHIKILFPNFNLLHQTQSTSNSLFLQLFTYKLILLVCVSILPPHMQIFIIFILFEIRHNLILVFIRHTSFLGFILPHCLRNRNQRWLQFFRQSVSLYNSLNIVVQHLQLVFLLLNSLQALYWSE
jgi:hypothetical protein